VQRVQSLYSKGAESDDSRLTSPHIYHKLLTVRARLVKQELDKRKKLSSWVYQTLDCVELIKAPSHECPCLPPIGCEILKTKHPIPKVLANRYGDQIQSVTSVDGSIRYEPTTWGSKQDSSGNKYAGGVPDYYIKNEYFYFTWLKGPRVVSITAIFEDTLAADTFPSFCPKEDVETDNSDCLNFNDQNFAIDGHLIEPMIELAVNELVILFSQMREDSTNNFRDNVKEETK